MATTPNKFLRENEEMRSHIAQLKRDLEQQKNAVKQAHRDKVAEVKSAREEETARYRRELETQLDKLRRDARNEKQNMERTLKQQFQFELEQRQKAQEEEVNTLNEKWSKEKNELLTKMKDKLQAEAMEEARKKFEVIRKQMTTEMFQMDTARNEAEEKAKTLAAADQEKAEELRKLAEIHRAELDRIRREAQHTDNQHRDEIKNKDRQLAAKNKEAIVLGEKLSRMQSERDKLQEDVQRYKQGDSFYKMTPKSPSIGIGDKSFEEVTAATLAPKVYSEHEKELILKNGELSFRVKEVEKQNQMLKESKENLERTLDRLKEANKPLEEKNKKLFQRCIEMQGAKQRQELRNNQLTSEIDELKSKNVSLEKEVALQHRRLTHLLGESGSSRSNLSTLKAQNERLKSDIKELRAKIQAGDRRCSELQLSMDRMRRQNYQLRQKSLELEKARQPASPVPSNASSLELSHGHSHLDLRTVDEESHCSILQEELEQVTFDYAEMETNYTMLKREKLLLEKENCYLKQQLSAGEYDTQRETVKMQQLKHERDEALGKLQLMEDELVSIADSGDIEESTKEMHKLSTKQEEPTKWHKLEAKLVETEASLAAAQEKVTEFAQREEQFLQQLQGISGELEHSREQHQVEITNLREELSKQKLQNTRGEDVESQIMKLQLELRQQVKENETVLQRSRVEMAAKEQKHFAELAQLNEAIKMVENETANTIEALRLKISELELSGAQANEKVFNLNKEKASIEVSLQQQLAEVKEELDQVKDASITDQESWKERFASELKAQQSAVIDGLAKEHRAEVAGLEEQKVAITAELEESRSQLQQVTSAVIEKEGTLAELTDKLSHSEQQLLNVRKILQEARPTLIGPVVTDSKTGRTINDIIKDLISEVDDGTLTLLVTEQDQTSQPQDEDHAHQLKETISNMQLVLSQLNLEKDQVKQEVSQLTIERDQLREGYNQLEQHIHQLSQERDQMKARYSQLEQQVLQINQLKSTNDQIEQQDQELNQTTEKEDIDQQNQDQELKKTKEKEDIDQLNQERTHLLERQTYLEQQVDELNQSRRQLKERHEELEEQIDQLNQQYADLKQANAQLENLNNQLRGENDKLREQLQSHNEMARKREAQLKEQLIEDSKVMVEMQEQLKDAQHSLSNSLHQVDEKNSLLTTSQSKCQILEYELQESETRNHSLQKKHDKLQLEHARLQRELSEISVTLKEMSISAQLKERENSVLRAQSVQQQTQPAFLSNMENHVASNGIHKQRLFVTLLDYNPQSFCRSGHPDRELQLHAGDVVNVVGDMNSDGYFHVQFENRQGLVPANFLEEMNIKSTAIKRRLRNQRLSSCSLTSNGDVNNDSAVNMIQYQSSEDELLSPQSVAPQPPTELKVERVLQRGLVVSWTLPNITALGDSNGIKIQGYQIFIDDLLNSTVLGCYQSKALIGSINVDRPHTVAVATFALNGTLSNKCKVQYKPIHVTHDHHNTMTRFSHTHQPSDSSPHHQNYRLMKVTHSPIPSDSQLRLQEGDIVKVFGRLRKDGNYIAEVNGDHVLIPGYLLIPIISGV